MATLICTIATGVISIVNLGITADLISEYSSSAFPSREVRNIVIYALATSVWGMLLAIGLPFAFKHTEIYGTSNTTATSFLFMTFFVDLVSAALFIKGAAHGGACVVKSASTCNLYTAGMVVEWIMVGATFVTMIFSAMFNTSAHAIAEKYGYGV